MSLQPKIDNAEAALMELSLFFVRHSLPYWPAQFAPTLQSLRANDALKALEQWASVALMGEYGLMQLVVSHDLGYRAADMQAEQQHFQRLLQQALDTINNLRFYVRSGVNRPLIDIYPDVAL